MAPRAQLLAAALSFVSLVTLAPSSAAAQQPTTVPRSSKRGLVYTPNSRWPNDDFVWAAPPSDLTWYYNYGATPTSAYGNTSQESFEFVPMLWGAPDSPSTNTTFLDQVRALVKGGRNISHVMSFNEPDGTSVTGGSQVDPAVGAQVWVNNFIPLQQMGIQVGLPACTGGEGGIPWLDQFLANCSLLAKKNCTYDFVPLHWYGDFQGLASHIGQYVASFPNSSLWVTEFAFNDQSLSDTESFVTTSLAYMDRLAYLARYSYFGAFRSKVSNVGPNVAMLSDGGRLTQIGVWYLGESGKGVAPSDTSAGALLAPPMTAVVSLVLGALVAAL